jgi:hypothetical protein
MSLEAMRHGLHLSQAKPADLSPGKRLPQAPPYGGRGMRLWLYAKGLGYQALLSGVPSRSLERLTSSVQGPGFALSSYAAAVFTFCSASSEDW